PQEAARALAQAALPDRGERVALYCGGGIAATLTAFALERLGYSRLSVYDGSLEEWTANPALATVVDGDASPSPHGQERRQP
uniref:rhodanese-like domain-containing protein n=1 Tax=uncultured Rhizobium sp. TaxID=155567 RepID=UPI0026347934